MFHSDQGTQYSSKAFIDYCNQNHFFKFQAQAAIKTLISSPTCPLSRFLESLKSDLKGSVPNISISQQTYATRAQARSAIFEYNWVYFL
jgi:hypothetical protein